MKGILYRYLGRYGDPAPEDVVSAVKRVWQKLKPEVAQKHVDLAAPLQPKHHRRLPVAAIAAATLVILISVFLVRSWKSLEENSPRRHGEGDLAMTPQKEPAAVFEVVSIRRSVPLTGGNRGGADPAGPLPPCVNSPRVFPQRFTLPRGTIYHLIALAYGQVCPLDVDLDLIAGGPEWIKSDRFDIQALMPEGSPAYTQSDLTRGNAPKLQMMLQTLLADRFKLVLHRETHERPIYSLAVAKPGNMKRSEDQTPPVPPERRSGGPRLGTPPRGVMLVQPKAPDSNLWIVSASAIPVSRLVDFLQGSVERVIVDKTGLTGLFDIRLEIAADLGPGAPPDAQKEFNSEILEHLGLKLESSRGPVEVLVIDHIEHPSEN
jgi:uncharacterized protein (TIGR03435 family)